MTAPTRYRGSARVRGQVDDYRDAFDPLNWPKFGPFLWEDTYLIPFVETYSPPPAISPPQGQGPPGGSDPNARPPQDQGPPGGGGPNAGRPPGPAGGSDPDTGLPNVRSEDPARAPDQTQWNGMNLFEAALFGGFLYRNVLETSLVNDKEEISLTYRQVQCLETKGRRAFDGGIDTDYGVGSVVAVKGEGVEAKVDMTLAKTVRFTQPRPLVGEVNALAHVAIPLFFDFYLHTAMFRSRR